MTESSCLVVCKPCSFESIIQYKGLSYSSNQIYPKLQALTTTFPRLTQIPLLAALTLWDCSPRFHKLASILQRGAGNAAAADLLNE